MRFSLELKGGVWKEIPNSCPLSCSHRFHLAGPTELNYQIKVPEGKAIPVSLAAQQMPG